jgi:hypothetical protein
VGAAKVGSVAMELIGRRAECGLLDETLHDGRSGESRVLVLHGDPGVGNRR